MSADELFLRSRFTSFFSFSNSWRGSLKCDYMVYSFPISACVFQSCIYTLISTRERDGCSSFVSRECYGYVKVFAEGTK